MKVHACLAALALVVGGNVLATPRIDAREARQEKRIQQGVASGQLTPNEAQRLENGEARIKTVEANAKADGVVTGKERQHLEKMENRESRAIYHEKHDAQRDLNHDGKRDRVHKS